MPSQDFATNSGNTKITHIPPIFPQTISIHAKYFTRILINFAP